MRTLFVSFVFLLLCLFCRQETFAQSGAKIANTKHNLSVSGPGPIKVAAETEICKFCHTPHSANPIAPLWNRQDAGNYYETYKSTTLAAAVGQPTGSSRLCLSCHDGTVALTQTYNARNAIQGGSIYISSRERGVGTDLTDDHPVSFAYDAALAARTRELHPPMRLPRELPLDHQGQLQCTTCHEPHDDTFGQFLRMDNRESQMCVSCHAPEGWSSSSHSTSSARLDSARTDRWNNLRASSVREAGCESCHRPHNAGGRQRLLRHEAEEDNCLSCHDGSVTSKNIASELQKFSAHQVNLTTGVHDPTEDPLTMPTHVECADCHNPHQSMSSAGASAPFAKPSMKGAGGVTSFGRRVDKATYEYEICYKCHAWRSAARNPFVDRVIRNANVAEQFSPANSSYHPVETHGKNPLVPSLLQPLLATSIIYCTDCHGSDASDGGPKGPHGSNTRPLLAANYVTIDNTPESPAAYALCYKCHNRASILADQSFSLHRKHIVGENAPCSVCHDAHGVSATQSLAAAGAHLINFDRDVVKASPSAGAGPTYTSTGPRSGSCTLLCHGKDHKNATYP